MSYWDSFLRGGGAGATLGWGDEGAGGLLSLMPSQDDGTGIPRTYAAGSAAQDYTNSFRQDNEQAAEANPKMYGAGMFAGALPGALAMPTAGGASAAGRIAATGLMGGGAGFVGGAGAATEGNRLREGAKGAALGSALGTGGAAVMESLPLIRGAFAARAPAAAEVAPVSINRSAQFPPRRDSGVWHMPAIPKAGKTISEAELGHLENVSDAADNLTSAANQRLVERSYKKAAARTKPIDVEAERANALADRSIGRAATVRPGKKMGAAASKKKAPPVQQELPLDPPKQWYHATPADNVPSIQNEGLVPGKPSAHHTQPQNRTFFSSEDAHTGYWKDKLQNYKGGAPMAELRTNAPAGPPEASLGWRHQPTPPERLEIKDAAGQWKRLKEPAPVEAPPVLGPPALRSEEDKQLILDLLKRR